jgi:hypothetical protein
VPRRPISEIGHRNPCIGIVFWRVDMAITEGRAGCDRHVNGDLQHGHDRIPSKFRRNVRTARCIHLGRAPVGVPIIEEYDRVTCNLLVAGRVSGLLRQNRPSDRTYDVLPMSHIVGCSILLISTLMHGSTLHVIAKADPAALAHAIAEEGITSLFGVPATYQRLLEYKAVKGIQIEDELGIPLLNNYSITECSPGLSGVRSDLFQTSRLAPFFPVSSTGSWTGKAGRLRSAKWASCTFAAPT